MSDRPEEPPLDEELEEMTRIRTREILRLADLALKHRERKAVTQPHPVYPTEPDAA